MLKVGLTGGLASGKSFVAGLFAEWGAHTLEADRLGRETLLPDGEAYADVVREFGKEILDAESRIDRKRLAAVVFSDPEKLERLNSLVHPHVYRRQREFFSRVRAEDPHAVAVVEAAILIETGGRERYDRIVLAACPPEMQVERFTRREGATAEEARARMARQTPLEQKIPLADYLVDTSGPKEQTRQRAREVYVKLVEEARRT